MFGLLGLFGRFGLFGLPGLLGLTVGADAPPAGAGSGAAAPVVAPVAAPVCPLPLPAAADCAAVPAVADPLWLGFTRCGVGVKSTKQVRSLPGLPGCL